MTMVMMTKKNSPPVGNPTLESLGGGGDQQLAETADGRRAAK